MPKKTQPETEYNRLVRAIIACPADDSLRLIFADWLDENGDEERAKFIRLQIDLTRLARYTDAWEELFQQQLELRWKHADRWTSGLPKARGAQWQSWAFGLQTGEPWDSWSRGFPAEVEFNSAAAFEKYAAQCFEASPVEYLSLGGKVTINTLPRILNSPLLKQVTALVIWHSYLGDEGAKMVAECPHLTNVRFLRFGSSGISTEGALTLLNSPHLANVRTFLLHGNYPMEEEGAVAFAKEPALARIEHLTLCSGGNRAVAALADSPHVPNLQTLQIGGHQKVTDKGVKALANSSNLKSLRSLHLFQNNVSNRGAKALAENTGLPNLVDLNLGRNKIGTPGALALAKSSALDGLRHLWFAWVDQEQLGTDGVKALTDRFGSRFEMPFV